MRYAFDHLSREESKARIVTCSLLIPLVDIYKKALPKQ